MDDLVAGDLRIDIEAADGVLTCSWRGRSVEHQAEKALKPFFERLIGDAVAGKRAVIMHFEELAHFNSATIGSLIVFIQRAHREKVKLTMVYDPALRWQRLSFDALRMFERGDQLFALVAVDPA